VQAVQQVGGWGCVLAAWAQECRQETPERAVSVEGGGLGRVGGVGWATQRCGGKRPSLALLWPFFSLSPRVRKLLGI
jgi:hypothetical protein